jgi:CHASE3 domain sensor protein
VFSHRPHSYLLTLLEITERNKMDNHELMEIIKHLTQDKKDMQKRIDILEKILHAHLPVVEKK